MVNLLIVTVPDEPGTDIMFIMSGLEGMKAVLSDFHSLHWRRMKISDWQILMRYLR